MVSKSMEDIAAILSKVKFKRKMFGGVDEADVWRIIDKLQNEYRNVVDEKQIRCDELLKEKDRIIAQLKSERNDRRY